MSCFARATARELVWASTVVVLFMACDGSDPTPPPDRQPSIEYRVVRTIGGGHLDDPMGIAMAPTEILVADTGHARVARFTSGGDLRGDIEGEGLELVRPMDVARTSDGAVWISDFGGDRVWRAADGRAEIVHAMEAPAGLGLAGEDVLVAAFYDHHVVRLRRGRTEVFLGEDGDGDGQLHYPTDVAEDEQGALYVADSYNHRVQVFDREGRFVRVLDGGDDRLNVPVSVAVRDGVAHVADSGNHRVVALDTRSGQVRGQYRLDVPEGGPHTPSRIAGAGDRLLIADPAADVVLELEVRRRSR